MSRISLGQETPAPVFAALGSAARPELVSRFSDGHEDSVSNLADDLTLSRQGVTKHLHVLQEAGIVKSRRVGRESRFVIRPESITQAGQYLAQVSGQWDSAISRHKARVEK